MSFTKYQATIAKALCEGVNTARKEIDGLRLELQRAGGNTLLEREINAQIRVYDEWIVELADALHWLNGKELREMTNLRYAQKCRRQS